MTKHSRRAPAAIFLGGAVLLSLALSACSVPELFDPTSPSPGAEPGSETNPESGTSADPVLPLDVYWAGLFGLTGNEAEDVEKQRERDVESAEIFAACMQREGFTVVPEPEQEAADMVETSASPADLESKEWVEKYGYGEVFLPGGPTWQVQQKQKEEEPPPSANTLYKRSLTPDEQTAYEKAVSGDGVTDDTLTVTNDWERMGCNGEALHAVPNKYVIMDSSQGKAVEDAMAQLYEQYWSWEGIVEVQEAWSACMTSAGYAGYDRQDAPAVEFADRNAGLWEGLDQGESPAAAEMEALAAEERAVALVDLDCRVDTNYAARVFAETAKKEQQFMDDNKDLLDALSAATVAGGE